MSMRFLYFYVTMETGAGRHVQSLVVGSMAVIVGFLLFMLGVMAHLLANNRLLLEEILYRQKKMSAGAGGTGVGETRAEPGDVDHASPVVTNPFE